MKVKNETESKGNGGVGIAWFGAIIMWVGQRLPIDYWLIPFLIGMAITITGCILWAQRKKRNWAFGFWGIAAPIGFIGISLLKDKSRQV